MSNNYPNFMSDSLREAMAKIAEKQSETLASISKIDFSETIKPLTEQLEISKKLIAASATNFDFSAALNPLSEQLAQIASQQQQIVANSGLVMSERLKQNLNAATLAMRNANVSAIAEATMALQRLDYSAVLKSLSALADVSEYNIDSMLENGDITEEDIANEFQAQIYGVKNESVSEKSELVKNNLKAFVIKVIFIILAILCAPVIDTAKNELVEAFRINEFWQNTGIIEWIEEWFDNDDTAVSEEEAKASVELPESTNLSKGRREDLINKIAEIRGFIAKAEQDENTAQLLAYLGDLEKDVNGKKYGLVFEEHREAIDEVLDNYTPVLTEDEDLFIDNGGNVNFLIEGDNLASLELLEKTCRGRIDVICIDPPYNRGKQDFKYNDKFIEMSDQFKHSKWLSFISKRIEIMKSLLSPNGIILINIDENEISSLYSLCQSVFGDENVDSIVWQKTDSRVDRNTNAKVIHRFKSIHESIIICYKNKSNTYFNKMMRLPEWKNKQKNPDNDPRGAWSSGIVSYEEGHKNEDKNSEYYYTITTPSGKHYTRHWFVLKDEFERLVADNRIAFPKGGDGVPRIKTFENEEKEYYMDSILRGVGTSSTAKDELLEIFENRDIFDTPKPTKLIMELIRVTSKKDSSVLDVFAGSGTTGHAVMKLNAEDGGTRKFILCTNNENNICRDITYERIKRVIDKEDYSASLKYYQVQYVPIQERMYYEYADSLLLHIRELVELENGINFKGNSEIAIVLTDEELEEFVGGIGEENKCKKLYMGHDLLPDEEQDRILRDNEIEICIIPDYYYRDLQER